MLLDLTLSDIEGQNLYVMVLTLDFHLKFTSFIDVEVLDWVLHLMSKITAATFDLMYN